MPTSHFNASSRSATTREPRLPSASASSPTPSASAASRRWRSPRRSSSGWSGWALATTPSSRSPVTARSTQARRAEAEIAAGRWRGPLHGIPYGAKDLLATGGGIPTTWGAAPLRGQAFDEDATVIRQARGGRRGARARSWRWWSWPAAWAIASRNASFTGPGVNPWGGDAWSGGSSSGSGSAVAAGLVPVRDRLGDVGLDPLARGVLRRHRPAADLRPGQPSRRDGALLDARQAGPARAHRGRLRPRPRRDRRARSGAIRPQPDRPFRYEADEVVGRRFRFGVAARTWPRLREPRCARTSSARSRCCGRSARSRRSTLPDLPYEAHHPHDPAVRGGERLRGPDRERRDRASSPRPRTATRPTRATRSWPRTTSRPCGCAGSMAREADRVLARSTRSSRPAGPPRRLLSTGSSVACIARPVTRWAPSATLPASPPSVSPTASPPTACPQPAVHGPGLGGKHRARRRPRLAGHHRLAPPPGCLRWGARRAPTCPPRSAPRRSRGASRAW